MCISISDPFFGLDRPYERKILFFFQGPLWPSVRLAKEPMLPKGEFSQASRLCWRNYNWGFFYLFRTSSLWATGVPGSGLRISKSPQSCGPGEHHDHVDQVIIIIKCGQGEHYIMVMVGLILVFQRGLPPFKIWLKYFATIYARVNYHN